MSRYFDGSSGLDQYITLAPGSVLTDAGPLTVLCYWQPDATQDHGLVGGRASGSEQWAVSAFSGQYYHADDFTGGPAVVSGAWQIIGYSKPAGTSAVRWHRWDSTNGWTHVDGASGDDGTAIDDIRLGDTFGGTRADGWWVCAAVWSSELADAAVESAASPTALQDWYDASPDALWAGNQATTSDPVVDLTGNGADETATNNPAVSATEPPGWSYTISSGVTGAGIGYGAAFGAADVSKVAPGGSVISGGGAGAAVPAKLTAETGQTAGAAYGEAATTKHAAAVGMGLGAGYGQVQLSTVRQTRASTLGGGIGRSAASRAVATIAAGYGAGYGGHRPQAVLVAARGTAAARSTTASVATRSTTASVATRSTTAEVSVR